MYNSSTSRMKKLFTSFLLFMPILNIYNTHFIRALRIGEFLGLIFIGYILCRNPAIKITHKGYWLTIFYFILVSLLLTVFIPAYSLADTLIRSLRVLFYTFLAFGLAPKYWDDEYGKRIYTKLSVFTSVIVLIQFVLLQIINKFIPFVLPGMNLSTNYPTSKEYYAAMQHDFGWYGKSTRATGLFLEPAHFCEFVIFVLVILLFTNQKTKKAYWSIVIVTLAVAISRSALGFFLLAIIYGIKFVSILWAKKISSKKILLGLIACMAGLIMVYRFGLLEKAIWRVLTIHDTNTSTGNARLLRGLIIYEKMPLLFQVIGMGFGNFGAFIETFNIVTFFDATLNRTNEFMNTISIVLVSGGLIGILLYIFSLFKIYIHANKIQKIMFLIFMVISAASNTFYKETYMLMLIFIGYQVKNQGRQETKWQHQKNVHVWF